MNTGMLIYTLSIHRHLHTELCTHRDTFTHTDIHTDTHRGIVKHRKVHTSVHVYIKYIQACTPNKHLQAEEDIERKKASFSSFFHSWVV